MPRRRKSDKCSLWWCARIPYAGGMCQKHYMRYWRNRSALRKDDDVGVLLSEIEIAHSLLSGLIDTIEDGDIEDGFSRVALAREWIERTTLVEGILNIYKQRG